MEHFLRSLYAVKKRIYNESERKHLWLALVLVLIVLIIAVNTLPSYVTARVEDELRENIQFSLEQGMEPESYEKDTLQIVTEKETENVTDLKAWTAKGQVSDDILETEQEYAAETEQEYAADIEAETGPERTANIEIEGVTEPESADGLESDPDVTWEMFLDRLSLAYEIPYEVRGNFYRELLDILLASESSWLSDEISLENMENAIDQIENGLSECDDLEEEKEYIEIARLRLRHWHESEKQTE